MLMDLSLACGPADVPIMRTPLGRDGCLLTPRRYGFAHALGGGGGGQAVGWCMCANCC